ASASASSGSRRPAPLDRTGCRTTARIRNVSSAVVIILRLVKRDRLRWHDGRDRMLVDKLRLSITAQQNTEIIEPRDDALQLHAVHQENGHGDLGFPDVIEKRVLEVLFFGSHFFNLKLCCAREAPLLFLTGITMGEAGSIPLRHSFFCPHCSCSTSPGRARARPHGITRFHPPPR